PAHHGAHPVRGGLRGAQRPAAYSRQHGAPGLLLSFPHRSPAHSRGTRCSGAETDIKAERPADLPPMPETPWDALGKMLREQVIIDGHTFLIQRPDESDKLLDHPAVRAAFAVNEYMPYWTELWPAARMLAKVIMRETWPPGVTAIEIGCGLGLPGIVAQAKGMHVIFTDFDATALRLA